jgi:hypothetical protein
MSPLLHTIFNFLLNCVLLFFCSNAQTYQLVFIITFFQETIKAPLSPIWRYYHKAGSVIKTLKKMIH